MKSIKTSILLGSCLLLAAACEVGSDVERNGNTPRPPDAYELDIVGVEVVNKDSGAAVSVGGLPAEGGVLTVE